MIPRSASSTLHFIQSFDGFGWLQPLHASDKILTSAFHLFSLTHYILLVFTLSHHSCTTQASTTIRGLSNNCSSVYCTHYLMKQSDLHCIDGQMCLTELALQFDKVFVPQFQEHVDSMWFWHVVSLRAGDVIQPTLHGVPSSKKQR